MICTAIVLLSDVKASKPKYRRQPVGIEHLASVLLTWPQKCAIQCKIIFVVLILWLYHYNIHYKDVAPCGLWGCKNGPAPFPGRMSYKATKPGLVFVLYLSMTFIVLVFIRAPFYVLLVFIICVVCLLVVLVKLSLLTKLLARKTPLSSESSPLQFLALA